MKQVLINGRIFNFYLCNVMKMSYVIYEMFTKKYSGFPCKIYVLTSDMT